MWRLHFLASIHNSFIMEYVVEEETTLRDEITSQARDGFVEIPEEPGLGVQLIDEAIDRYRQ